MQCLRGGSRVSCSTRAAPSRVTRRTVQVVKAAKTADGPTLAIVGSTGAVGQEFMTVLKEHNFPYSDIKFLASARSAGKKQEFEGVEYTVEELTADSFGGVDIALFSAGGSMSKKFGPIAAEAGSVVIDNSSAFRMTEGVPLIVPEVNPEDMADCKIGKGCIIANPNCSTIIALMACTPLHKAANCKRMIVSTYQAVSGAGAVAMEELANQSRDVLEGKPASPSVFPVQCAFNLFSHNSGMDEEIGYNEEEMKLTKETAKIWKNKDVKVMATCIRVPVMRAHAESIVMEFEKELDTATALELLSKAPGVTVMDDRKANRFPTPLDATNQDNVYVGRVRKDISADGNNSLAFFVCGDQIKKGAALNAVQIAEQVLAQSK